MDVIDEGGFGCVIRPPLNCDKGPKANKSMVSKLQRTKHANYEMSQIKKIKKICKLIPNCKNYVMTNVKMCTPKITKKINSKSKCSLLEEGLVSVSYSYNKSKKRKRTIKTKNIIEKLKIINIPYGGINLHRYILDKANFNNPQTFVSINNSIIELYKNFIMILNNNNFYHNDIKTLNILVDKEGRYRLIDFGISNKIIFSPIFIFNKPYMYILLSNYYLEKIEELKKNEQLNREQVEQLILSYVELIKINKSSDYLYTKEILEFLFPNSKTEQIINPILLETLIQTSLRYNSSEEWTDIYIHNLDIVSIALMYPDILCAMAIKKSFNLKIQQGITSIFTKYVLECYTKINRQEFIDDLHNLNM
jgi:serine/threonine protein kinase